MSLRAFVLAPSHACVPMGLHALVLAPFCAYVLFLLVPFPYVLDILCICLLRMCHYILKHGLAGAPLCLRAIVLALLLW